MKKLSKKDQERLISLTEGLKEKAEEVRSAVAAYNEAVSEANGFREEKHGKMEAYFGERSEKWQEGEAGDTYQSWMEEWEEELEEVEEPEMDHADTLDSLPTEPG